MNRQLRAGFSVFLAAVAGVLGGCAADSTLGEPVGHGDARLEGRVDGQAMAEANGSTVEVSRIVPGGKSEVVATGSGKVGANGGFTVEVDPRAAGAGTLVVSVVKDGKTLGSALVTAALEAGHTILVKPIDVESSAEVTVLAAISAEGSAKVPPALIELLVDRDLAIELVQHDAAKIAAAAHATAAASLALSASLAATGKADLAAVEAKLANEAAELDAKLEQQKSQAALDALIAAEADFVVKAYLDAGVTAADLATAAHAAAAAAVKLAGSAEGRVQANADKLRARVVAKAIEAELALVAAEKQTLTLGDALVIEAKAKLAGAKAKLEATVAKASSAAQIAEAYAIFFAEAHAKATITALIAGGASEARAQAALTIAAELIASGK